MLAAGAVLIGVQACSCSSAYGLPVFSDAGADARVDTGTETGTETGTMPGGTDGAAAAPVAQTPSDNGAKPPPGRKP
jgi:hypothetical protein